MSVVAWEETASKGPSLQYSPPAQWGLPLPDKPCRCGLATSLYPLTSGVGLHRGPSLQGCLPGSFNRKRYTETKS